MEQYDDDDDEAFCEDADAEEILEIDENESTENFIENMNDIEIDDELDTNTEELIQDDSIGMHKEHTDEVFCVSFNPIDKSLIASGGKDDQAIVWDSNAQKVVFKCTGHKESIAAISFSSNGQFLATGDLNGLVKVWSVKTGQEIWSFEVEEIQWMCWHHKASFLLAGTIDGNVWLWHVPFTQTKTLPSHGSSAICGKFMPDGKEACCGYEDGLVRIWDLKMTTFVCSVDTRQKDETSSILCIDCHPKSGVVIAGSTNGSSILINSHNGQILARYIYKGNDSEDEEDEESKRIESIAFSRLESCANYVCTGNGRGEVNIWDITTHTLRHSLSPQHTADVIKILWHPSQPLIISASADGDIFVVDARNGNHVNQLTGHLKSILDFDLSCDGNNIVSCGEDMTVRIFHTIKI